MIDWQAEYLTNLEVQRAMQEQDLRWKQQMADYERRMQIIGLCAEVYMNAELGPSFAMLNPDPAVYPIARKGADEVQALALKAMAEYGFTP